MELHLHIGIHKTGSSYIQYICSNARKELKNNKIWFPVSEEEFKMKRGLISAGNGIQLCRLIDSGKKSKIEDYLLRSKNQAKDENCNSILLSAEGLGHRFSDSDKLQLFNKAVLAVGFSNVSVISFFRDVVDHCISLYKHRSKAGRNGDFEYWVRNNYETPILMNDLFKSYQLVDFNWTFKKFRKDSNYMIKTFFDDWLNVRLSSIPEKTRVNESLTLSEVIVMQQFRPKFPNTFDYLLNIFKSIPRISKASDKELERFYKSRAGAVLSNTQSSNLEIWNQHLSTKDQLVIEESALEGFDSAVTEVYLSDRQIGSLIEATIYLSGMKSFGFRTRRIVRKILPSYVLRLFVKFRRVIQTK